MNSDKRRELATLYREYLLEGNLDCADEILEIALEDSELTMLILEENRLYEEQEDLVPSSEEQQRSLNKLQFLLGTSVDTTTDVPCSDSTTKETQKTEAAPTSSNLKLVSGQTNRKDSERKHSGQASTKKANKYQKALLVTEIIDQLHNERRFGPVKCKKIFYICEYNTPLPTLQTKYMRYAAGPFNNNLLYGAYDEMQKNRWFRPVKEGRFTKYEPLANRGGHREHYFNYWGHKHDDIQAIIDLMRPLRTQETEIIATLYAAWNDFIIDGISCDDQAIIHDIRHNWDDSKKKIPVREWQRWLNWMRGHSLVPVGFGRKTTIKPSKR